MNAVKTKRVSVTVIHKGGRRRLANARRDSRSGRSRGEIVDMTVVLNQPHRRGADNPRDQELGYPLGRLHRSGQIDGGQLEAGNAWARLVRAYAKMQGIPLGNPSTFDWSAVSSGFYHWETNSSHESDEDRAKREAALRAAYNDCYRALLDAGDVYRIGNRVLITCRRVCVDEIDEGAMDWRGNTDIGILRIGLNELLKTLRSVK